MSDLTADRRYRSRKFILCVSVLAISTGTMFYCLPHVLQKIPHLVPLLTWWSGTTTVILGLYKAAQIADDKLNGQQNG